MLTFWGNCDVTSGLVSISPSMYNHKCTHKHLFLGIIILSHSKFTLYSIKPALYLKLRMLVPSLPTDNLKMSTAGSCSNCKCRVTSWISQYYTFTCCPTLTDCHLMSISLFHVKWYMFACICFFALSLYHSEFKVYIIKLAIHPKLRILAPLPWTDT